MKLMNIMHSSRSDSWGTPSEVIERVKQVLGNIDFDPASSEFFNRVVGASEYCSADSLDREWLMGSIYLNPPGGKTGNRSNTVLYWEKLISHRTSIGFKHAIFMAFSLEALQTTQGKGFSSIGEFPMCIPSKRIKFIHPLNKKIAPSHSNVIVYVSGSENRLERFVEVFQEMGIIING